MMPYCGSTTRWRLHPLHTTSPQRRQWWRALTCCALLWKVLSQLKCAPQHAHEGGASSKGCQRGGCSGAARAALSRFARAPRGLAATLAAARSSAGAPSGPPSAFALVRFARAFGFQRTCT